MPIILKTVISELQFIDRLATDNKKDSRLASLLEQAKKDLAKAAQNVLADDPLIGS